MPLHKDNPATMSNYSEEEKVHSTTRIETNNQLQAPHGGELNPGVHAPVAAQKVRSFLSLLSFFQFYTPFSLLLLLLLQNPLKLTPFFQKIANPAPLGLGAFALTTFVLSLINVGANSITAPNVVVGLAYAYGGLIQLLAGMWEMAVGNTFGATALSSYGGFWISFGIVLTPAFGIVDSYTDTTTGVSSFNAAFALYLWAWFFFTFCMLMLTLRSTVAFFSLFFTLDLAFLFLAIQHQVTDATTAAHMGVAGGSFGLVAAFLAWYNMFAGIADSSNFFFGTFRCWCPL